MIIESPEVSYEVVGCRSSNEINDIYVCRKLNNASWENVTVIVIHDRGIAHRVVEVLSGEEGDNFRFGTFTWKSDFCVVFPYGESRLVENFLFTGKISGEECETIVRKLVMLCMSCDLPYPLLYQILKNKSFNLKRDMDLEINYELDFRGFNPDAREKDCIQLCTEFIIELFNRVGEKSLVGYQVLIKNREHQNCQSFFELYQELKYSSVILGKEGLLKRCKRYFRERSHMYFAILKVVCVCLGAVALITFLSQLVLGDIPFFRIFTNTFKVIGERQLFK